MHDTISTFEQIIEDVANAMKEIEEFIKKEIIEDLPKEALLCEDIWDYVN